MDFNNPESEIRLPPSYYPIRLIIKDENLFRSQLKKDDVDGNKKDDVDRKRSTSSSKNNKPIKSSGPPKEIINLDDDDDDDVIIIDRSNLMSNPLENGISECVIKEKCQRYALAWQYSSMKFRPYRPLLDAMSDHWDKKPSEIDALIGNMVSKLPIPIQRKPPSTVNVQNSKPKRTNTRRTVVRGPRVQKAKKSATKKTAGKKSSASKNQEINNNLNGGENIEQSILVKQNIQPVSENIQPIIENTQPIIENNVSFDQNLGNDKCSVNLDFDLDLDFLSNNDQNIQPTPQNTSNACSNFQKNPDTTSAVNQSGDIRPVIENNVSFNQNFGNDNSVNLDFDFDLDLDFSSNNDQNIQPSPQNTSNACSNFQENLNSTSAVNQSGEKSSFDQEMPQSNPNPGNQPNDGNSMVNIDEPEQQNQQKLVPQTDGNIYDKDINNNDISYTSCPDCVDGIICTNCASVMFSEFPWDAPNHDEQVSIPETNNNKILDESDARMLDMDFLTSGIDFSEISFPDTQDEKMDTIFDFEQNLWDSFNLL